MSTTLAPANSRRLRFSAAQKFGVDPATGALSDLVLLAAGREAIGHGIYIDDETLATALACVEEDGGRLKAYVTHNHGGPCSWDSPAMDDASSELAIPGFFSGFAIKSAQLVAAQFEFYAAFKKNFAPQYEQLLEMAVKTPDLLGLSIEAYGYAVYVAKDGTEYGARPVDTELLYDGLPAFRITDLFAAAFVSDPAATDGLFAKFSRLFGAKRAAPDRAAFAAALTQFATEFAAAESNTQPLAPNSSEALAASTTSTTTPAPLSSMITIAQLKAKFADPKQFAAAAQIVGNQPEISLQALEAELIQLDLAAVRSEVATLKASLATAATERETLAAQLTATATARDDFKAKFEAIKSSGAAPAVNLGAASAGAGVENPWAPGSVNLTAQSALLRSNPALAASMEAAAKAAPAKK